MVGGFLIFDVKDHESFDELSKLVENAKEGAHPRELIESDKNWP